MEDKREIGFVVRRLSCQLRRFVESSDLMPHELTHMQGRVIGYLMHHDGDDVFQRDLERRFQIRRSTATAMLQVMERNGLLTREPVPYDARLKKLVMTDAAREHCARFEQTLQRIERQITRGVDEQEIAQFFATAEKFIANLEMDGGTQE